MPDYDVIVIGAGNGGLVAAASLAQRGLNVLLLERHNVPGGAATSFCRGRFEFEVALHQLSGLGREDKPGPLRMLLDGLGVTGDLEFVEMSDLYSLHRPPGFRLKLKADKDQALTELKDKFPHQAEALDKFFSLVYEFASNFLAAFVFRDPEASRSKYPVLYAYAFRTVKRVLDELFTDPLLKAALSAYWGYLGLSPDQMAFTYLAMLFFSFIEFKPFHLKGGSQALSNALLNKFLKSGGEARFNCPAAGIEVKDGAAGAVVTADGDRITTRFVVSNASPLLTYLKLIGRDKVPEGVLAEMRGRNISTSAFSMFVGLDCPPQQVGLTESTNFLLADTDIAAGPRLKMERIEIGDELLVLSCYDVADPGFSPPGTCQCNVVTLKYGEPWLRLPPARYFEVKYRCAEAMLRRVEEVFPGFRAHIEEIEVGTPLTHMRYLGHPAGAVYGYEQQTKDSLFFQPGRQSPLKGLYFAGGWAGDCGFQSTLESGQATARAVLRSLEKV
ncbi:MAG: NAD(P)/FAD-dependent oxidoreductase [Pseudomonadota bacterium]